MTIHGDFECCDQSATFIGKLSSSTAAPNSKKITGVLQKMAAVASLTFLTTWWAAYSPPNYKGSGSNPGKFVIYLLV